jgi:hypothetical protein
MTRLVSSFIGSSLSWGTGSGLLGFGNWGFVCVWVWARLKDAPINNTKVKTGTRTALILPVTDFILKFYSAPMDLKTVKEWEEPSAHPHHNLDTIIWTP